MSNTKKAHYLRNQAMFVSKILEKPKVQNMIKTLRKDGLIVDVTPSGYKCTAISPQGEDIIIFRAVRGKNNYLVRMVSDLFVRSS